MGKTKEIRFYITYLKRIDTCYKKKKHQAIVQIINYKTNKKLANPARDYIAFEFLEISEPMQY